MTQEEVDVVIVGAGHAGGVCALALRRYGFAGSIRVIGSESVAPYERPSLSKEMLTKKESEPRFIASPERWRNSGINLELGITVEKIYRERRQIDLSSGRSISYGKLVLATGGRPRRLSCAVESPRIFSLRSEADSRKIAEISKRSRNAILVGGGVIGLEAAAGLRSLGLDVTILEAADRLLSRNTPRDVAGWVEQIHRREGNVIHLSRTIVAIEDFGDSVRVTLSDGAKLQADFALIGVGIEPEYELASAAGLKCDDGILVDDSYRSLSDSNAFAIGDVAAKVSSPGLAPVRSETWAHAQASAEIAARAICGLAAEPGPVAWWWTRQFEHTLQVAGVTASADGVVKRGEHILLYVDMAGVLVGTAMLDAPKEFALARRMIIQGVMLDTLRAADRAVAFREIVVAPAQSIPARAGVV